MDLIVGSLGKCNLQYYSSFLLLRGLLIMFSFTEICTDSSSLSQFMKLESQI